MTLDDKTRVEARHKIDGGPSVLFDAVAIMPSADGATLLARDAAAKDFVSDAFAHCKFIGYSRAAATLFAAARIPAKVDAGMIELSPDKVTAFLTQCGKLRFWPRESEVDLDAV